MAIQVVRRDHPEAPFTSGMSDLSIPRVGDLGEDEDGVLYYCVSADPLKWVFYDNPSNPLRSCPPSSGI